MSSSSECQSFLSLAESDRSPQQGQQAELGAAWLAVQRRAGPLEVKPRPTRGARAVGWRGAPSQVVGPEAAGQVVAVLVGAVLEAAWPCQRTPASTSST